MQLSICTISFRHQLVSLEYLAEWARSNCFDGIELWGVHGRSLALQPQYDAKWLADMGLSVSMVSDYIPLVGERRIAQEKCQSVCQLANFWKTPKIRTFAGHIASESVSRGERAEMITRLRHVCDYAAGLGLEVLVETHPNTLADTPSSIFQLLDQVDHPALKINFDTLHVWESGADPCEFHQKIEENVAHYHLKNIASRHQLSVFAPDNVYSPAGTREGMVSLFEGALDYKAFLADIITDSNKSASLEWFGDDVKPVLLKDKVAFAKLQQEVKMKELAFAL
ncbi:sugar phosphate isomerase/epimerase [Photobacterium makurazakiensis]|uniref:sugar phosphate isomerase/epimerase family protein n=1 Tax=Photobacterium makurazakiensis TaxID=2910234 RepID=UPI003D10666C